MKDKSINEIVNQCKGGDGQAFETLVKFYQRRLYFFILSIVKNHSSTDDILQNTFLKIYQNISKYDDKYDFDNWVFKVTVNQCRDYFRKEKHYKISSTVPSHFNGVFDLTNDIIPLNPPLVKGEIGGLLNDVEAIVLNNEQSALLHSAITSLPEQQKIAFSLFAIEEFPIKQIAKIMSCSEGTVMSHLHRARENLRKRLKETTNFSN